MEAPPPLTEASTVVDSLSSGRESKQPKPNHVRVFVESIHLSTLLASYNHHFGLYSEGRKNVSQLIPGAVWRSVYKDFMEKYPTATFAEDTLKKKVADELKSAKTGTSNTGDGKASLKRNLFWKAEAYSRSC